MDEYDDETEEMMKTFRLFSLITRSPLVRLTSSSFTPTTSQGATWADLPSNILIGLIKHLDINTDIPRLRSVCPTWRAALPLDLIPSLGAAFNGVPPLFPLDPLPLLLRQTHFLLLSPPTSSTHSPFLARVLQRTVKHQPTWRIVNPSDSSDPISLLRTLLPLTGSLSLLDIPILHISSPFTLVRGPTPSDPMGLRGDVISNKVAGGWDFIGRYIIAVLALLKPECGAGLVYMSIGDLEWERIPKTADIADVAFYNQLFYAFDLATWRVGVVDPEKTSPPSMKFTIKGPDVKRKHGGFVTKVTVDGVGHLLKSANLVPTKGKLYLVLEVKPIGPHTETKVVVFVLDEGRKKFVRVTSREGVDDVLFVGGDVAFGVPAEKLGQQWKGGSICMFDKFTKEAEDGKSKTKWRKYLRMVKLDDEEGVVGPCGEVEKKLFYPPPEYVKWKCPALGGFETKLGSMWA